MSEPETASLSPEALSVLRGEYLDLLLLAGRISGRAEGTAETQSTDAAAIRSWVLARLREARQRLNLRHFSGAPHALIEAEIAVIAYLDSAAVRAFTVRVWRTLREDLHRDYVDHIDGDGRLAGREPSKVVDLGKYVFDRLEALRLHPERLTREPVELLEVYDRCLRLGYNASYEDAGALTAIKARLGEELRERGQRPRGAAGEPGARAALAELDPTLTPDLPPLGAAAVRLPALNPGVIVALGLLLVVLAGTSVWALLKRDERVVQAQVRQTIRNVEERIGNAESVCPRGDSSPPLGIPHDTPPLAQR
jgi:hypothetical protein